MYGPAAPIISVVAGGVNLCASVTNSSMLLSKILNRRWLMYGFLFSKAWSHVDLLEGSGWFNFEHSNLLPYLTLLYLTLPHTSPYLTSTHLTHYLTLRLTSYLTSTPLTLPYHPYIFPCLTLHLTLLYLTLPYLTFDAKWVAGANSTTDVCRRSNVKGCARNVN